MLKIQKRDKRIIRLHCRGKQKYNIFNIVLTSKLKRNKGYVKERLGFYNPNNNEKMFYLNTQRIAYWLNKGVKLTNAAKKCIILLAVGSRRKKKKNYE